MIGGITKGSDFAGCVRYALALDDPGKEARLLYCEGVLTDTPQDIIDGFECQRHLNSRVRHWCAHISLSYSPKDKDRMTDEFMVKLALEYMEKWASRIPSLLLPDIWTRSIRTVISSIIG